MMNSRRLIRSYEVQDLTPSGRRDYVIAPCSRALDHVPSKCNNSIIRIGPKDRCGSTGDIGCLFNHPVSAQQERLGNIQSECLGGFVVDYKFKLSCLFHG